jgi:hypothetical protein
MTDAERASPKPRSEGPHGRTTEFGKRARTTEFDAAAGRRNQGLRHGKASRVRRPGKFLGEDGEPDAKAIKAASSASCPKKDGPPVVRRRDPHAAPSPAGHVGAHPQGRRPSVTQHQPARLAPLHTTQ